jgi:RNase P subunit RPR2
MPDVDNRLTIDLWRCNACKALFLFDFDCDKYIDDEGDTHDVVFCCPACGEEESIGEVETLKFLRRVFVDRQILRNKAREGGSA